MGSSPDQFEEIQATLTGSPYLFADDESGRKRIGVVVERGARLLRTYHAAQESYSSEATEIRTLLDQLTTAREVFETNALELAGMSQERTKEEILKAPTELESLAAYVTANSLRSDRHLMEVLGMHQAGIFARRLVQQFRDNDEPIREIDLRNLHRLAVGYEEFAGSYRTIEVAIGGSQHTPVPAIQVPQSMEELVSWLTESHALAPLKAAVAHSWLTHIHPFQDGNGRVARLLATVALLQDNWPPLIVRASDRLQYLDALGHSDHAGDIGPLFDLFVKSLKSTVREISDPRLAVTLWEKQIQSDADARYNVWLTNLDAFLDAVSDGLATLGMRLFRVTIPVKSAILRLEAKDPSGNAWLARIEDVDRRHLAIIWMGYMSDEMDAYRSGIRAPSLFISVRDHRPEARHPYLSPFEKNVLPLDEICIQPSVSQEPVLMRYRTTVDQESIQGAATQTVQILRRVTPIG